MAQRVASLATTAGIPVVPASSATAVVVCCRAVRSAEARAIRQLQRVHPRCDVVLVAQSADIPRVRLALEAGATAVILEQDLSAALGPALASVAAGQLCLPALYRENGAKPTLTTREKQILGLVVLGLSNGEIGSKLYLAESTVKSHLSSAFMKLGVRSRNEATARILDPASGFGRGILRITETLGPKR